MLMDIGDVLCKAQVIVSIALVTDQPEKVETRQESSWELDVGLSRFLDVVSAKGGVGSCQD